MRTTFHAPCLAALALAGLACVSALEGPQVRKVPPGFGYSAQAPTGTGLGGRRITTQRLWMGLSERSGSVGVVELRGAAAKGEIDAAHREAAARASPDAKVSALEHLRIDGAPAWCWKEVSPWSRTVTAVVVGGDATWVVSYHASNPKLQDDAAMMDVVTSFVRDGNAAGDAATIVVATLVIAGLVSASLLFARSRKHGEPVNEPARRDARWPR